MESKKCKTCGEVLPISDFSKTGKGKYYGRYTSNECKKCAYKRVTEWREKNKESSCAYKREWNAKNPEKVILASTKTRAKRDGILFDLTVEDIVIPSVCPVFNVPLVKNNKPGASHFSPSVDRIIPSLGYVKGNIQIISHLANRMKSNATPEQLNQFADWINYGNSDS